MIPVAYGIAIAFSFPVIVISAVSVHVFEEESQVPTVEQSPPSFALRVSPSVEIVPLGGGGGARGGAAYNA